MLVPVFFFSHENKPKLSVNEGVTEFRSLDAIAWDDFNGTRASSAPAMTNTGRFSTALRSKAAI